MFEKVNPSHPDKLADRIAGALVDYCYTQEESPRVAIEVLIGHGTCHIIAESSVALNDPAVVNPIVNRIAPGIRCIEIASYVQDQNLAKNQENGFRCGDNGIFKGMPVTDEQKSLSCIARGIYREYPTDGKYILNGERLIICQSNAKSEDLRSRYPNADINPLGWWSGGPDVDTGATNRKLGSDMGDGVTGGGLHGKDLSKADVSVNIYCHLEAQKQGRPIQMCCAIGDKTVDGVPYEKIVSVAKEYIRHIGGFEKFAEWGLI